MIKKISTSICIQILGICASLGLVWIITKFYGAAILGQFVLIKSWIDLSIVIFSLGLPQSFIYVINKFNTSWYTLRKYVFVYIPLVTFLSLFLTYIWFYLVQKANFLNIYGYICISLAISSLTGYSLLRGLYITQNDGNKFALVTITPNVLLCSLSLLIFFLFERNINIPFLYMISGFGALIFVNNELGGFKNKNIRNNQDFNLIPWRILFGSGFNVFIQNIFGSLLPFSTYWIMAKFGYSQTEIGIFSISTYFYIILSIPLNMISPIFYNRWSAMGDDVVIAELIRFVKLGFLLIPIGLFIYLMLPWIIPIIFGKEIALAIFPAKLLLVAAFVLYFNNLFSCFILSKGKFKVISFITISKTLFCVVVICIMGIIFNKNLGIISLSWLLSEFLVLFLYIFNFRKLKIKLYAV